VKDVIKYLKRKGVCTEKDWPFEIKKVKKNPSLELVNKAKEHRECFKNLKVYELDKEPNVIL
jgi:hypothetical protein